MLSKVLKELGLPENSNRAYIKLLESGPQSARKLAENLGIPRPSVYDNLKLLKERGLVSEKEKNNKKIFQVDDIKNIPRLLQDKIEKLTQEKKAIDKLLPKLATQATSIEPKVKFYSGTEGIKQVLRDLLWYENIETLTMWPIVEMVEILGREYLANLNRKRIKQSISIKAIWPRDKAVDLKQYPFLGVGKGHLRELRLAPNHMSWDMSYWLYADKVAFISSQSESFGFVIHSKDFTELIKIQFEVIWKMSKPVSPLPKYTDDFLKTV